MYGPSGRPKADKRHYVCRDHAHVSAWWSVFSSLPQPLMAPAAYLFVETFRDHLPTGLGFAAGAMIWMVFSGLVPDALH